MPAVTAVGRNAMMKIARIRVLIIYSTAGQRGPHLAACCAVHRAFVSAQR